MTSPAPATPQPAQTGDIPVTRAELEAECLRIIEATGMPDDTTWLAGLVIGYLSEVDKRHWPRRRMRMGEPAGTVCDYDNHRWPCADVVAGRGAADGSPMHAHDGYAPHSHEVRADHHGVRGAADGGDRTCPLCEAPLNRDGSCSRSCAGVGDG